ncbi:uncharacterized protein Triagg1_2722 [Trichoderma aggressivum f. europaeum]|uniref:2EXR domain-containing protein n=1 Tax=Trichoderma aggressivum f. europaeum TaxID=173218 RepID=A0AAE1JB38_9HYPO|nr:hypothetical protein Triagg1_2722 [Trichoderma aggressivum f. europaeum]
MYEDSELLLRYAEETEDDSYDSAVEYEFYNGTDPWDENPYAGRVFPKFAELPPELRLKIWELGLVEAERPRVLPFEVHAIPRKMPGVFTENEYGDQIQRLFRDWHVRPGKDLARVTKQTRALVAVNREAREVARKILPHTLKVQNPARNGYGMVNFNRDRDVVQVDGYERGHISPRAPDERLEDSAYHFDGFAENVLQLAFHESAFDEDDTDNTTDEYFNHAMEAFRNLKRLFLLRPATNPMAPYVMNWCGSDFVYTYTTAIRDRGNDYLWTKRCWPNADDYDDFVRKNVPTPMLRDVPHPLLPTRDVWVLPMLSFDDKGALKRFDKARAKWQESYERGIYIGQLSDLSTDYDSDSQSEPDEYESEGIDDSEIIDNDSEDNSDDDDLSGDEVYGDDDDSTVDENEVGEIVPVFSSPEPEPEPNGLRDSPSDAQNSRKRRIVADSDDEDPSEGPGAKRARTTRPARVVTSDTEDEGESKPNSTGRSRRRAAIADSDEEDDDDGKDVEVKGIDEDVSGSKKDRKGATNGIKRNTRGQKDDEDDDEEEEEEEEVTDVRQLSLASRLNLVPQRHPSSRKRKAEDDESSNPEEYSEDDDDEDDDDDEERSDDDLIDGIAEESDESDDE